MSNPEGLFLDPPRNSLIIGQRLGSGACGVVHDVVISRNVSVSNLKDEPASLAVKLVPYVVPSALSNKKKKKNEAQRNADLIYHEYMLYRNVLNPLRGTVIPLVPLSSGYNGFGDIPGYRYLLLEKMEKPLFGIPSSDMASSFGQIATTLISHIEQVHALGFLVVDVKPENFMVAYNSTKKAQSLHSRIRVIDVGLFEKFLDAMSQKHRQDVYPNGPIVGTPIYASLNVLEGHGISRRDDIEALGYVIIEMLLLIHQSASGKQATVPARSLLPWSNGKSDDEILQSKRVIMDEFLSFPKSTKKSAISVFTSLPFFSDLSRHGNESATHALREYMALSRQLAFAAIPDYDALKKIVGNIVIRLPLKNAMGTSSSTDIKTLEKPSSSRRVHTRIVKTTIIREEESFSDEDEKVTERSSHRKHAKISKCENEDEETSYKTAEAGQDMDWECVETESSNVAIAPSFNKLKETPSLQLVAVEGPYSGDSFSVSSTCIFGRQNAKNGVNLIKDTKVAASHAKFTLTASRQGVLSLRVTDLKASNGTFVNNSQIPMGGYRQAFIGDKIKLGSTIFEVIKCS